MKPLKTILDEYCKDNGFSADMLTAEDAGVMMDKWLEENPMPEITDLESFNQAVNKAMWVLRSNEAATFFSGKSYPLNVASYRWNIEHAIINRSEDKTMLFAALEYVEYITSRAHSIGH